MKKRVLPILLCLIVVISLCGCSIPGGSKSNSSPTGDISETNAPILLPDSTAGIPHPKPPAETTAVPTLPAYEQEANYTWKPYVMSEIYSELYGEEFTVDFQSMVNAFLSYESTFSCSSAEQADAINTAAGNCFPLLRMDVYFVEYDSVRKTGVLDYTWPKEDHMAGIKNFQNSITDFITSCVRKSDNGLTRALAMYMAYSVRITYDYTALEDNSTADLSSYAGLTAYKGICQTFGPSYAYLCLQMGIDAVNAGGLNTDSQAHDWTLVKLDGSYYYMDTTWENGDGGFGLKYFGMTSIDRENAGNYINETTNVGNTNEIWGDDIDVSSTRFAVLHSAVYACFNTERTQVDCTRADGSQWTFPLV